MIAAKHNHVLAFDNLSGIRPSMSDALCTTATGIGQAGRRLYSDDDENIVRAKRPIMLNGIDDVARRADLLDRSIVLRLPAIRVRKTERELDAAFEEAWPFILGAIFDAASAGLANYDSVRTDNLPRMADFCQWIIACEPALPFAPGSFLEAYREIKSRAEAMLLDSEGLAAVLERFIEANDSVEDGIYYDGTPTGLLAVLQKHDTNRVLPKKAHWLTNDLKRLNPALRREWRIEFAYGKRTGTRRPIYIRRVGDANDANDATDD